MGSVRFVSEQLERDYIRQALEKSVVEGRYTPLIAAAMFLVSAPMDIALIGKGALTPDVQACLWARGIWVILLILSSVIQDRFNNTVRSAALIFGWFGSVFVIWFLAIQAPLEVGQYYSVLFGLASLSTITLLPAFNHWQVPAMNACLVLPLAERAWFSLPQTPDGEAWAYVTMFFVAASMTVFSIFSKRSYDIVLRKDYALQLELAVARDDAIAADQAKSRFLSSVSHDMRTPLNAILGNIQLLRRTGAQPEPQLDDAEMASRTLLNLVESVLHTASGDAPEPVVEDVVIADLVTEIRSSIQVLADQKDLVFETSVRGEAPIVRTDQRKLVQILLNLLNNALKFTPSGRIGLRLRQKNRRLHFIVFDTGVGIAPHEVKNAFAERFRGAHPDEAHAPGFGLGLSITRNLVELLGGAVRLRSRLGRGTVVAGWVPAEVAQRAPEASKDASLDPLRPLHVLVIEDEALNIAVLTRMLDHLGQSSSFATTGAAGLDAFAKGTFDCVFIDIRLPDMTGLETLERMMALPQAQADTAPPVYAVTANVLPDDLARYEAAGFDGVIPKPIDLYVLVQALQNIPAVQGTLGAETQAGQDGAILEGLDADLQALYQSTVQDCMTSLQMALSNQDYVRASQSAHRVRGAALYVSDETTANLALSVEEAGQDCANQNWREAATNLVVRLMDLSECPSVEASV